MKMVNTYPALDLTERDYRGYPLSFFQEGRIEDKRLLRLSFLLENPNEVVKHLDDTVSSIEQAIDSNKRAMLTREVYLALYRIAFGIVRRNLPRYNSPKIHFMIREGVEDITQDIVLKTIKNIPLFAPYAPFISWYKIIVFNTVRNYRIKRWNRVAMFSEIGFENNFPLNSRPSDPDNTSWTIQDPLEELADYEEAEKILGYFDADTQRILRCRIAGMSYRETAETLGITLPALKMRLHKTKEKAVEILEQREIEVPRGCLAKYKGVSARIATGKRLKSRKKIAR